MSLPQPSAWSEGQLRDHLAEHLEIIEPGLQLVKTEYHLPNPRGAAGFIDILGRDENGDLVVVELKRSDQSARQAIHELTKYVTLLADQRGIPAHRLRCYLVSTTWNELLVLRGALCVRSPTCRSSSPRHRATGRARTPSAHVR